MAAPTANVPQSVTPVIDEKSRLACVTTAQIYYPMEMLGWNTSGLLDKFADASSLRYAGVFAEGVRKEITSSSTATDRMLTIRRPRYITMLIASAAAGDEGKACYAAYSNEVQYTTGTYGNYVGRVHRVVSSTVVEIDTMAPESRDANLGLTLAATGNYTLTKNHLNRVIIVPNTAAKTLTLPAVAVTQPGEWIEFVKTTADAFAVTLDGNDSETIDGAATFAMPMLISARVRIISSGAAWYVDRSKGPSGAAAIAAARTLTAADSGGVFTVAKTSAYAITLPTPAQGLRFKFVVLDTGANAVTISDGSAHLLGAISINNTLTAATGTTITLASGGSVGDWLEFEGISATQYLVTGACIAASDITIA